MKKYIGTKIVKAKHMTMTEARKVLGEVLTSASDEEEGYLVDYANGHESWIPKGVFEEICRRLGTYIGYHWKQYTFEQLEKRMRELCGACQNALRKIEKSHITDFERGSWLLIQSRIIHR